MMSNLSKRVQESKKLVIKKVFSPFPNKVVYSTLTHNGEHHYQMVLEKVREQSTFGNKKISHDTIKASCIACHDWSAPCPGNSHHTICKHVIGAIRTHMAANGCSIVICDSIFDAIKLRKPGQSLVKIVSGQGQAVLWGVVEHKVKVLIGKIDLDDSGDDDILASGLLLLAANILVMRGSQAEAEGID